MVLPSSTPPWPSRREWRSIWFLYLQFSGSTLCSETVQFTKYNSDANFDAVGENKGITYSINIPWNKKKMSDGDYLSAFYHIVLPLAYKVLLPAKRHIHR